MSDRKRALIVLAIFAAALLVLLVVSRLTGPSFEELGRLRGIERSEQVILAVAARGLGALTDNDARAAYASFDGRQTPLMLAAAWSKLSLGRTGVLDPLSAARLPWLVLAALATAALYALVRPSYGRACAALAAATLAFAPRWLHGAAVTSEGATLASVYVIVLAAYARSISVRGTRRRMCWAIGAAALLGFGLCLSLASLWVLALIAAHFAIARWFSSRVLIARGRLPAPAMLLLSVAVAPVVMLAVNPALWKTNGAALVRWVLAPLEPTIAPALYAGKLVTALPVPGGYAAHFTLRTLPIAITLAALLGAAVVVHQALARRFASGSLRPRRDRQALGSLLALGALGALIGPAFAPDALTRFPPRVELALPFVAALAAIGLTRIIAAQRPRVGHSIAIGVVALTAILSLRSPKTLSAAFDPVLGGARGVAATDAFALGDGSELQALAPALERLGSVALHAPEVPPETWDALRKLGRSQASIQPAPAAAPGVYSLVRGRAPGNAVASVERSGTRLWTLVR